LQRATLTKKKARQDGSFNCNQSQSSYIILFLTQNSRSVNKININKYNFQGPQCGKQEEKRRKNVIIHKKWAQQLSARQKQTNEKCYEKDVANMSEKGCRRALVRWLEDKCVKIDRRSYGKCNAFWPIWLLLEF